MTSIDDLFRKPNAAPKRKLEDPSSSFPSHQRDQSNKAAKLSNGASPHSSSRGQPHRSKSAVLQDEQPEDNDMSNGNDDDDIEAGPALPPDDNADDEEVDEDEEGRFFGGGVTKQERQVLDYIDENADDEHETQDKIDLPWLKKTALNFERKINKNAELRAKYEDDPMKFVGSEADLDAEIKGIGLLTEHTELYADFVRSGCAGSLVGLLAHENTDIAISVCDLIGDLTDEDTGADAKQWGVLVDALVDADVVDLLVSNLGRLDETNESDGQGVYYVLNVAENFMSEPRHFETFGANARFLEWLKTRIKTPDPDARAKVSQNRQYAAEILAILLQGNEQNRDRFAKIDGVDVLLQLLSVYRKRDPEKDSDEQEFAENLFDCLVAVVKDTQGSNKFIDGEGVELCLIMLKEGKLSKARSLRVFDHALGGVQGGIVGDRIVEAAGLKTLFSTFMKTKKQDRETIEHIIGIFSSLLRYLPAESAARIRTLAKFVENDYEKAARLVELRKDYATRVGQVDEQVRKEKAKMTPEEVEESEAEWLSRRFDAGFFTLQALDVILAWLIAEDDGASNKISELLAAYGYKGQEVLRESLQGQLDGIDSEQGNDTKEMLEALLKCFA